MILLRLRRCVALAWALLVCRIRLYQVLTRGPMTHEMQAAWLRSACEGVLDALGVRCHVSGHPPTRGLVVSNHLSYVDILIYGAVMPCAFVSKVEVKKWPYFGAAARAGGTIFISRTSRASTAAVAVEIGSRLKGRVPVLLFPEGTSTGGSSVLPFHAALFEPAVAARAPVTAAAVRYRIEGGAEEQELCWFGDAPFLPHLWKALGTPGFHAEVSFSEPIVYGDRRSAAAGTHEKAVKIRDRWAGHRERICFDVAPV